MIDSAQAASLLEVLKTRIYKKPGNDRKRSPKQSKKKTNTAQAWKYCKYWHKRFATESLLFFHQRSNLYSSFISVFTAAFPFLDMYESLTKSVSITVWNLFCKYKTHSSHNGPNHDVLCWRMPSLSTDSGCPHGILDTIHWNQRY